jgi:hypothetical protein
VDGEAAHVADIGQMAVQLESVDEASSGLEPAFDAEGQDGTGTAGLVLLGPLVPRARFQSGIGDPLDLVSGLEPLRDRERVLAVPLHPQAQRLEAL